MSTGLLSNENKQFVVQHEVGGVAGVVGYPTKLWYATKKYSINGTISTAALNTWVQFSLAYVTAIMITRNDLSFLTNILDPRAISLYAFVSIVLVTAFLTSVTLKYMYKQKVKDEKLINQRIRGGQSDEINYLAQNALTIEIVPDVRYITDKKISINVPIAENQGTVLENQEAENTNKVIFFTAPYVISSLIVAGALGKFGFSNIRGWEEISFISIVVTVAIVGAFVALNKMRDNKIYHESNTTIKFGSPNIIPFFNTLFPFSRSKITLVIENKVKSKEDNDIVSRILKLIDQKLTDFVNIINDSTLQPLSAKVQGVLDGVRTDFSTLLSELKTNITQDIGKVKTAANQAIAECLQSIAGSINELCKEVKKDVQGKLGEANVQEIMILVSNLSTLAKTLEDMLARLQPGKFTGLVGATFVDERIHNSGGEFMGVLKKFKKDKEELIERIRMLEEKRGKKSLSNNTRATLEIIEEAEESPEEKMRASDTRTTEEMQNQQQAPESGYSSSAGSQNGDNTITTPLEKEINELRKKKQDVQLESEYLKLQQDLRDKQKDNKKLKNRLIEDEEKDVWRKKLNGSPKEFLDYILKAITLRIGGKEVLLQDYDNKILIHWKNGSQTICYINKKIELQRKNVEPPGPNMYVDIQATYAATKATDDLNLKSF